MSPGIPFRKRTRRARQPGRDRVDGNTMFAEFGGRRAGKADHAGFAGDVVDEIWHEEAHRV